ncbi:MAG TPA: esterase-like activity of phytase family protein, partial [Polyangia bacterium]
TPFASDSAASALPYDPDGLDTEDLRRLPSGDFAFTDEYSPSVGIIDGATGHIKVRYVPSTVALAAHYSVAAILPSVLTNRRANKGFEGLALAPDGHTAWAVLQTPMGDDGASHYGNSLVDRVIRIDHFDDPTSATVGGHFIVLHQTAAALFPAGGAAQKNVYYNSATYIAANKLLLLERISNPTDGMPGHLTLVVADFGAATNLVGHPELGESTLDPETVGPPAGYTTLGITPAATTVVFDSNDVPAFLQSPPSGAVTPDKLEGVAIINKTTIGIADDNDFGIFNVADRSRIWILRTKAPMF